MYAGSKWDFFSDSDPTGGQVNYQSKAAATKKKLAYIDSENFAIVRVDSWTNLAKGANRDSVRITSKKTYSGGLFIADFAAMPTGCGTWVRRSWHCMRREFDCFLRSLHIGPWVRTGQ